MIELKRRSFLGGFAAALATPAIIRTPALLMPLSVRPPTFQEIVEEFNRILQWNVGRQAKAADLVAPRDVGQMHIDMIIAATDLRLPLHEIASRYLVPAASVMARNLTGKQLSLCHSNCLSMLTPPLWLRSTKFLFGACGDMTY